MDIIKMKWIIFIIISAIVILQLIFVTTQEMNLLEKDDQVKKNDKLDDNKQNKISGHEHGNDKKVILNMKQLNVFYIILFCSIIVVLFCFCSNCKQCELFSKNRLTPVSVYETNKEKIDSAIEIESPIELQPVERNLQNQLKHSSRRRRRNLLVNQLHDELYAIVPYETYQEEQLSSDEYLTEERITLRERNIQSSQEEDCQESSSTCFVTSAIIEKESTPELEC